MELVYIILKGITGFSYISRDEDSEVSKVKKVTLLDPNADDATIELKKIKIKDVSQWEGNGESRSTLIQSDENEVNRF